MVKEQQRCHEMGSAADVLVKKYLSMMGVGYRIASIRFMSNIIRSQDEIIQRFMFSALADLLFYRRKDNLLSALLYFCLANFESTIAKTCLMTAGELISSGELIS